jgi:hypothetical protein
MVHGFLYFRQICETTIDHIGDSISDFHLRDLHLLPNRFQPDGILKPQGDMGKSSRTPKTRGTMMTSKYFDANLPECSFLVKAAVPLLNPMKEVKPVTIPTAKNAEGSAVDTIQTSPFRAAQPTFWTCLLMPTN